MEGKNLDELAREERLAYFKEWRAKNKDRIKAHNQNYWKRKVEKRLVEEKQLKERGELIMSTSNSKPQMLTIPQLEAMRILPGRAIRRLVAEKTIPTVQVGNRQYINLVVFERYLTGEEKDQP